MNKNVFNDFILYLICCNHISLKFTLIILLFILLLLYVTLLRLSEKESQTAAAESLHEELIPVKQSLNDATNRNEEVSNKVENLNKINLKLRAQLKAVKQERDKFREVYILFVFLVFL